MDYRIWENISHVGLWGTMGAYTRYIIKPIILSYSSNEILRTDSDVMWFTCDVMWYIIYQECKAFYGRRVKFTQIPAPMHCMNSLPALHS